MINMIDFNCFPSGVHNCVTFSFDDGAKEDIRLAEMFNKYGLKGTFNLSDCMIRVLGEDFDRTYEGHEIACHGAEHRKINLLSDVAIIDEMLTNRKTLEALTGYPVVGHAYAGGYHDDRSIEALKKCGIVYARTTMNTGGFDIPKDFLRWHPTCHQKRAGEFAEKFIARTEKNDYPSLLYIWGHSFEFKSEEDWTEFEKACKLLSNNEKIWYATNIEVYNYVEALKRVRVSADESIIYNQSSIDIWVTANKQIVKIPSGEKIKVI